MILNIIHLLKKEITLEWRFKSALGGIVIYVVAAAFIIYYAFKGSVEPQAFISLFWIISIFSAINVAQRSFQKDAQQQYYYLRSVVSPIQLILSKIIYNLLINILLSIILFGVLSLFFGAQMENIPLFMLTFLLGSWGFANIFSLLSAITARTNNLVLLSILGFPLILPLILLLMKLSNLTGTTGYFDKDINISIIGLTILDTITLLLSVILFPYLWRD